MTQADHHPFWKWLGVIFVVILGLFALKVVIFPFVCWLSSLVWSVAGVLAGILHFFIYLFLLIAVIIGILMLIAWIIRQFME